MNAATEAIPAAPQKSTSPSPVYRSSELGTIPVDWRILDIGDLRPFVTSGSRGWAQYYSDLGAPFLRITNMSRESVYLDISDLKLVDLPTGQSEADRTQLKDGDVLISITADIGIIGYVDERISKPAYINQHIALVRFDSTETEPKFISYLLASHFPQRVFRGLTDQGAKAGMSLLTIRKLKVLHPKIDEQREIAGALSDADALIGALDQLIAKKRAIKLATMQRLLTGQTRLPTFTGKWRDCVLGKLGKFFKGRGIKRDDVTDDGVPCIRYGEIYTRYDNYVFELASRIPASVAANSLPIYRGDLLFAGSGETADEIGKCVAYLGEGQAFAGGDIIALRPTSDDSLYLGHLLNQQTVVQQKVQFGQGDAVVHINARNLGRIELRLPDVDEQRSIARVLCDMDSELAALKRRRDKSKAIKQGMMQELLTGRTRLV